jgi:hypothetical protein
LLSLGQELVTVVLIQLPFLFLSLCLSLEHHHQLPQVRLRALMNDVNWDGRGRSDMYHFGKGTNFLLFQDSSPVCCRSSPIEVLTLVEPFLFSYSVGHRFVRGGTLGASQTEWDQDGREDLRQAKDQRFRAIETGAARDSVDGTRQPPQHCTSPLLFVWVCGWCTLFLVSSNNKQQQSTTINHNKKKEVAELFFLLSLSCGSCATVASPPPPPFPLLRSACLKPWNRNTGCIW